MNQMTSPLGLRAAVLFTMFAVLGCDGTAASRIEDPARGRDGGTAVDAGFASEAGTSPEPLDAGMNQVDAGTEAPDASVRDIDAGVSESTGDCADSDLGSMLGVIATGTTIGATPDREFEGCWNDEGPSRTFRWTAPESGYYVFAVDFDVDYPVEAEAELWLIVQPGSCSAEPVDYCFPRFGDDARFYVLEVEAGQRFYLSVDSWSPDVAGDYVLSITPEEYECDDGVDNDGDGRVDCEELECSDRSVCSGVIVVPD